MNILWIALGGAVGTVARFELDGWVRERLGTAFPFGVLAVNLLGSFAMGLLMRVGGEPGLMSPTLRITLATGLVGGFTTYSAFNHDLLRYLQAGVWSVALVYVGATLLGCLAAGWLGWVCAKVLV